MDALYAFCECAVVGESYYPRTAISVGGIGFNTEMLLGSLLTALYTDSPTGLIVSDLSHTKQQCRIEMSVYLQRTFALVQTHTATEVSPKNITVTK